MSHLSAGRYSVVVRSVRDVDTPALPCNDGPIGLARTLTHYSLATSERGEISVYPCVRACACDVTRAWHRTFYELGQEGEIGHLTREHATRPSVYQAVVGRQDNFFSHSRVGFGSNPADLPGTRNWIRKRYRGKASKARSTVSIEIR